MTFTEICDKINDCKTLEDFQKVYDQYWDMIDGDYRWEIYRWMQGRQDLYNRCKLYMYEDLLHGGPIDWPGVRDD